MAPLVALQTTLFAQGDPEVRDDVAVVRHHLDEHSWLDVGRHWLAGADALMADLAENLDWRRGRRSMYGAMVDDPRLSAPLELESAATPPVIRQIARWLDHAYRDAIDSVWVNFYRDGRDSVAWHSDRVGRTHIDPLVAVVSLGGPRRFRLRPTGGGRSLSLTLGSGDLLVMGGACQHGWEHSVPKASGAPPRMSVTLRRREGLHDPAEDWYPDGGGATPRAGSSAATGRDPVPGPG